MGRENHIFWSEIGLRFEGVCCTPPPKFCGSTSFPWAQKLQKLYKSLKSVETGKNVTYASKGKLSCNLQKEATGKTSRLYVNMLIIM